MIGPQEARSARRGTVFPVPADARLHSSAPATVATLPKGGEAAARYSGLAAAPLADADAPVPAFTTRPLDNVAARLRDVALLSATRHAPVRPVPWERAVMVSDTGLLLACLAGVLITANADRMPNGIESFLALRVTVKNVALLAAMLLATPAVFRAVGLYDDDRLVTWSAEARRLGVACSIVSALMLVFPFTSRTGMFRAVDIGLVWVAALGATLLFRGVRRFVVHQQATDPRRVIIVGAGPRGRRIYRELSRARRPTYHVLGFVDTAPAAAPSPVSLGTVAELDAILMRHPIDEVFVTLPVGSRYQDIQQTISTCERAGVPVNYRADIFASRIAWAEYGDDGASPVVTMQVAPHGPPWAVKRVIDLVGAAMGLVLAAPLMLPIALAIRLTSRGPVLFAQERYGRNKRIFRMHKFRTMVPDASRLQDALEARNEMDGPVFKIRDDPRITPLGRLLRRTSLDELPQLFDVLTGQMSLVGPRPLPLRDVARFTRPSDMRRFSVRPGITCLWQISGRNEVRFDDWIALDLAYIDGWSLLLDFYILVCTIPAVLRGAGAR